MEEKLDQIYQKFRTYEKRGDLVIDSPAFELILGVCGKDELGRYKDSYRDYKDRGRCRCMLFSS